jgi:hypothetical protein
MMILHFLSELNNSLRTKSSFLKMTNSKTCTKCFIVKNLEDYYNHPYGLLGKDSKCKECAKSQISSLYSKKSMVDEFVIIERKRGRDKYHRLYVGTGKANPESNRRFFEKYPEKKAAHMKSQKLPRPSKEVEKHHWSYNEEHYKDVLWLTKKHHKKAHRFIVYDQGLKMYRNLNGELLDNKSKHMMYIAYCILNEEN